MRGTMVTLALIACLASSSYAEDKWTPSPLCPYPSEELTRFPYQGDCTKFWECFEGARYPMDCPTGLEYNESQQRCDTPSIAQCDQYETITYPTFPHSDLPTEPTVTDPNWSPDPLCPYPSETIIYYPCAENCSEYWECYNGKKYLMKCGPNLFWNVKYNYCDFLENVDCSQNNITLTPPPVTSAGTTVTKQPTSSAGPWTPDPLCPYPSEGITYFVYPANCSEYWECFEGNKYLMSCPGDLVWNEAASVCDYRENVDCSRTSTTKAPNTQSTATPASSATTRPTGTPGTTVTAAPVPSCDNLPDGTLIANPSDCSHFYECDGGNAVDKVCAGDLLWNKDTNACDYAENVKC